jgi:hypothetical protein
MLRVEAKLVGSKKALIPGWQIPLPPDWEQSGGPLTLRDVITYVVAQEVEAFRKRQESRRLTRVLTAAQIDEAAEKGKVEMGGREMDNQPVEEQAAMGAALQAFEDGLYYVFIDDQQQEALDREVVVRSDSHITFIRLVALAGG